MTAEATGGDLIRHLTNRHPRRQDCPGCGETIETVGLTELAYTFQNCACAAADWEHLIERIWHLVCLSDAAPDLAAADMLDSAAVVLGRYKRGQETAQRITDFLDSRASQDGVS